MPNWDEIRSDFPALKRFRYFYTASGGPLPRPVYEKAARYYRQTMESGDTCWEKNVGVRETVRQQVASLIQAHPDELEFVPSTAAGMNIVARLLVEEGSVIAPTLEFPDTTLPWIHLRPGAIRWVEPDSTGAVPVERIREKMSDGTAVIATSHVQFSNGFRQDLEALGNSKADHHLVVNATQSLGGFRVDVKRMKIDALCCNSYKWLLGGYGCGILYVSRRILENRPAPGVGWFAVQNRDELRNDGFEFLDSAARFNWGSPSFPTIFALGAAIEYLTQIGLENIEERVLELNRYLTDRLSRAGFRVLSPLQREAYRSAQTLVQLSEPQKTVQALAQENILCTLKPEGMRVATHFFVNEEDIDELVRALRRVAPL